MSRLAVIVALAISVTVAGPASTSGASGYYLSKGEAESATRSYLKEDIGYRWTAAACRPQGKAFGEGRGYDWHRWVCGWAAGVGSRYGRNDCAGVYRVRGTSDGRILFLALYKRGPACI